MHFVKQCEDSLHDMPAFAGISVLSCLVSAELYKEVNGTGHLMKRQTSRQSGAHTPAGLCWPSVF